MSAAKRMTILQDRLMMLDASASVEKILSGTKATEGELFTAISRLNRAAGNKLFEFDFRHMMVIRSVPAESCS